MGVNSRHLLILLLGFFMFFAEAPAFAVTSDDFSSPELNASLWTAINPRSDAAFTIEGSGTPDSALVINVPAGTDHDVWLLNMAPRIMQATANSDFEVEVKFQSSLTSQYQIQGVIVEQDSSNYMRFDFVRDNLGTKVYAASFSNGSASVKSNVSIINGNPLYLRINRTGNQWTESYSYNGTNWTTAGSFTHTLAVASIGPFAGNAGSPAPAFTSKIDYFFSTASPIIPEDGEDTYPPAVNIWYGPDQLFGYNGIPQAWVNILGNVSDYSGISALSYRLNGGLQVSLSIGPDSKRLQSAGDFNIDIAYSALSCGANTVDISATDTSSNVTTETVNIFYYCNTYWPRTYSIDWDTVTNIQDVAQIVDGSWTLEGSSITPVITGYDRLIAIGDIDPTWKDYEITVPITLNTPLNSSVPYGPIFGIIIHWQGHYDWDGTQPRWGWWPLGAMGIYDWVPQINDYRLRILGNAESSIAEDLSGRHLSVGVPYVFKMRAETVGSNTVYSLKVWEASIPEPSGWNLRGQGISAGLKQGSLLLLSHYADVSFGNVSVTPGPFSNDLTPPVISSIEITTDTTSAGISWTTDELASGSIAYGLTDAYELGTIQNIGMVTSRTITLTSLYAASTYHFRITSTDAYGNSSSSADLTFTTAADLSGIVSDDFSSGPLNTGIWNIVNPRNDATFSVDITGDADARLSINVPSGVSHDVWSGNMAPRIMQAAANVDFGVEVKFQSSLTSQYQIQGVIVEQDSSNFIRFDFVRDNIGTRVFAASFSNGTPTVRSDVRIANGNPLFLRVKRIGNQWTESYSYNGTSWTTAGSFSHTLTVAKIGPFAGNAGAPVPAFTPGIDYFFNMASPIISEDDGVNGNCIGLYYRDADSDTYGDALVTTEACSQPAGYVSDSSDCNDSNASVNPGATEVCNLIDDNCNGQVDEGVKNTYYRDADIDTYGKATVTMQACTQPSGYVSDSSDCNDGNSFVNPGAAEVCNLIDDNCNGQIDEGVRNTYYRDADNDTYGKASVTTQACTQPAGYVFNSSDCNDGNASVNPGAAEVCNLIDDNCNGQVDEGVKNTYYRDLDIDAYGNASVTTQACTQPSGYVSNSSDCNDGNGSVNPGAAEVCNLIDDNCNSQVDEGVENTYYRDVDSDTYGNASVTTRACTLPSGYVSNSTDCNDSNGSINPGAAEVCNLIDDNCNSQVDEGVENTYYRDVDNDTYGNASLTALACAQPAGYVSESSDCNDGNASVNPGATEVCNLIDDNCNGQTDEGVENTYYRDADLDTYGNSSVTTLACTLPSGYVSDSSDCNDSNISVNPGATEVCNLVDDNCNDQVDEGVENTYYRDADTDTYGNSSVTTLACTLPSGYVSDSSDCNDSNISVNPGATEVCNLIDDNCNGQTDEGVKNTYYRDADSDTYGNATVTMQACTQPLGYVSDSADCNDGNASVNPGATEVCNLIDDNCNGQTDEGVENTYYRDADTDTYGNVSVTTLACTQPLGYVSDSSDCNDGNASVNPGAAEVCNLIDDNCNSQVDEGVENTYYRDVDNDTYGSASLTTLACTQPSGYVSDSADCNDSSASVNPGATEVCNLIDDNCNGQTDEGVENTYYRDADSDIYGNAFVTTLACTQPSGYVSNSSDCNDGNASVNPGAAEICNLIDDNCNGQTDEGVENTYYRDADSDTYGNAFVTTQACTQPAGYVSDSSDCNDGNPAVNPNVAEVCNLIDDNCNGQTDEGVENTYYSDADSDTYGNATVTTLACTQPVGYVSDSSDCNDGNASVNPGAAEVCNLIDDNCNSQVDEGVENTYYRDVDNDTYGNASLTTLACTMPVGYVSDSADCNDGNASVNPGAAEVCNLVDDNCNGQTDEGVETTYYRDADSDTYGNASLTTLACTTPVGYVSDSADCNDGNASVNPGATEVCNLIDDNCNGQTDEGVENTYYRDVDNDTYGNASLTTLACTTPVGYVSDSSDCNDGNASVNPGATEVCNLIDDNCNGQTDEGVENTYYRDIDSDTYGNALVTTLACTQPLGYVSDSTDCNDGNVSVNPGATEVCNLIDDNCNGQTDEGVENTYYRDVDNDTYGNASLTTLACTTPVGYVSDSADCNDGNASVNPGATEVCNLIDDNCNGQTDEGVENTYYRDVDNDTYGNASLTTLACTTPVGYVSDSSDCNDGNASVNPGATEVCNLIDDNCNGQTDEGVENTYYRDADTDTYGNAAVTTLACTQPLGYVSDSADCNDGNASVNPGATEVCNLIDDNCNGQTDEGVENTYYRDIDSDTYGNAAVTTLACTTPAGYVSDSADCNDSSASVNPGATEVCNLIDDNCNGQVDEGVENTYYADADSDTHGDALVTTLACTQPLGYVSNSSDCNDSNALINPGAAEVCNLIDDNCNGQTDEGVENTYYRDADSDTYGNASVTMLACTQPVGYVSDNSDCNDGIAAVNPGAAEVCNLIDDNCNGQVDEGVENTYYRDADSDTYGNTFATTQACTKPLGYVSNGSDCNDGNVTVNPGATEVCNLVDDNCNGQEDEGVENTYYRDADNDTYGDTSVTTQACTQPLGYVSNSSDCNDSNAFVNPGAAEVCNLADDNCNGHVDEGVQNTYYADADSDTYGNVEVFTQACTQPAGYVSDSSDCNDSNASINPAASEAGNGADDNCNGLVDEALLTINTDNPPTILNLSEPVNGAIDMPTTLTLKWEIPTDAAGDPVAYELHIGTDPGLEGVSPIIIAAASSNNPATAMKYSFGVFGLFGIIAIGGMSKTGRKAGLLIIPIIMMTGVIFTSCGSSGNGSSNGTPTPDTSKIYESYTVTLKPNTTYYWKVVADKGNEGVTESETFSFKTK